MVTMKVPTGFLARINRVVDIGNRLYHISADNGLFTNMEGEFAFLSEFEEFKQNLLFDD